MRPSAVFYQRPRRVVDSSPTHNRLVGHAFFGHSGGKNLTAVYPRPLMEREQWMTLDGTWKFFYDDERLYTHPTQIKDWPRKITVPFPPESKASGIGDRGLHRGCWYERSFRIRADGGRILLHF